MFSGTFIMALKLVCTGFAFALLFRAYMNYMRLPSNARFASLAYYATDWAVKPATAFVPRYRNLPTPEIFVCYLTAIVYKFFYWLMGAGHFGLFSFVVGSAILVLYWAVELASWLAVAYCLASFVAPESAGYRLLRMLTDPYLAPFRKYIPPYKNFDVSVVVFFIAASIVANILWKFV